jgi:NACHT domain
MRLDREDSALGGGMQGWTRADLLALLGAVAGFLAVVVAIFPGTRRMVGRWWRSAALHSGFVRRRYARWFVQTYRVAYNVYLDRRERLDLGVTYVSLSLVGTGDVESRLAASRVIADRSASRLLIVGDPGSGKSTLLKAYGVGSIRQRHRLEIGELRFIAYTKEVPFFVPLRRFASAFERTGGSLHTYLVTELLMAQVGLHRHTAEAFLGYLLSAGRCLVLLDGLDELTKARYQVVRDAIYRFAEDRNPATPTHKARLVLTCRRQNFITIRDEWMPAFADRLHALSLFRDTEIFRYVQNLRGSFEAPQSPETFVNAVRAAGTMDLHRTPLVLAMSVGLYLARRTQEVPSSISLLYRAMVTELLGRHNFPTDPVAKVNQFEVRDKYRFLREFALDMAEREGAFQDFDRADILRTARRLAPRLEDVPIDRVGDFVGEIIERSGILSSTSEGHAFTFAHRSIQEYLVAEQLQRNWASGMRRLVAYSDDGEWRQVTLFFASSDHAQVDDFIRNLATKNLELAAHCLAGADASDEVAQEILTRLAAQLHCCAEIDAGLNAMLSATRSPRRPIRDFAVSHVEDVLLDLVTRPEPVRSFGGEVDGTLRVLDALAGTSAAKIAALVPALAASVPDDPRLVGILWRCLVAPGIEKLPASRDIVERLLALVMDPACFASLQCQLPFDRAFITTTLRRSAYPFERGLPLSSNLVTLLAWAEYLNVTPVRANRFYQAKVAGSAIFDGVERALRRTVRIRLHASARIISSAGLLAAIVAIVAIFIHDPRDFLKAGYGVLVMPLAFTLLVTVLTSAGAYLARKNRSSAAQMLEIYIDAGSGNALIALLHRTDRAFALTMTWWSLPYFWALLPLTAWSVFGYLVAGLGVAVILSLTCAKVCSADTRFYLYRPNLYVDMYDDPASRHWLQSANSHADN